MFQRKAKAASSFHIKAPTTSEKRKKLRSKKRHDTRRAATAASRRTGSEQQGHEFSPLGPAVVRILDHLLHEGVKVLVDLGRVGRVSAGACHTAEHSKADGSV